MQDLYPYYERELVFMRQMADEFASQYPATAARLRLDKDRSADPHVERLIEAFALIAGRVQHKIDDEFPEITESLLGLLCPHYLRPIPSLGIAQFHIDSQVSVPAGGVAIDRGTALHSRSPENVCTFRTCYPVHCWPVRIVAASLRSPSSAGVSDSGGVSSVLQLELETVGGIPFSKLPINTLRFYIDGNQSAAQALYELLFTQTKRIALRTPVERLEAPIDAVLEPDALKQVGLGTDEGLLPYPENSFLGYRLLQEYFSFPRKFHFFDLNGLQALARPGGGKRAEILICLGSGPRPERIARLEQHLSGEMFQLGCTPIVNLFDRLAEPIRLSQTTTEYRLIADQHRQLSTEVYSVNRVTSTATYQEEAREYAPFYSIRHSQRDDPSRHFWYAHRRSSTRKDDRGSEIFLTLVDLDFQPSLPSTEMLTVHVTCTNRDLPGKLSWTGGWGELLPDGIGSVKLRCIEKPKAPLRPPFRRSLHWRLISSLTLNHLTIDQGGLPALQEILRLYDFSESGEDRAAVEKQIAGIRELSSRPSVARVRSGNGIAFCRGMDITLKFDEQQYGGAAVFLFAAVLQSFFGLYSALNSFSRFTAKTNQGVLKQWPPLVGEQTIL